MISSSITCTFRKSFIYKRNCTFFIKIGFIPNVLKIFRNIKTVKRFVNISLFSINDFLSIGIKTGRYMGKGGLTYSNVDSLFTRKKSVIKYICNANPFLFNHKKYGNFTHSLTKKNNDKYSTVHKPLQMTTKFPLVSGSSSVPQIPSSNLSNDAHKFNDKFQYYLQSKSFYMTISESESYYHVENKQRSNIEKSRARRVITVRRALVGNVIITFCKLAAFSHSGSSAMLSEFIHSIVDCGNQSLLLLGLRDSNNKADRIHPYGYGKSIYFWALVSALGTFFLGAGVSMTHSLTELVYGSSLQKITWHVWSVLCVSLAVDGYVLFKTIQEVKEDIPNRSSFWKHVWSIRDPATLAILLEDGAACAGIVIAMCGIVITHTTEMAIFDALTGVSISSILAVMGLVLVRVNHRFLLGHSVDQDIIRGIEKILLNRRSIEALDNVQSQWTGPDTFSFKAEVDFDGTYLAATLIPRYQKEFSHTNSKIDQDLRLLLSWYAEDVMRTVEREVRHIEAEICSKYPGARFIELEPMGKDRDRFAIDDGMESQLKIIEIEALNRYLKSLYKNNLSEIKHEI